MKSFKSFLTEEIFIGHKIKLQELQKFVKDWSDRVRDVTEKLKKNSDVGQFGQFCKDYPEYVALYWNLKGKKLQPTKKEYYINKPIDSLTTDEKWDLFNGRGYSNV